jgi:hypothetical protein
MVVGVEKVTGLVVGVEAPGRRRRRRTQGEKQQKVQHSETRALFNVLQSRVSQPSSKHDAKSKA